MLYAALIAALQHNFMIISFSGMSSKKMIMKMNRKTVIIKKYGNRRLYDTTNSRYINQDEVAEMVQKGYPVQVVDAATGEALTRLVLTQIIVEHAKEPGSAFPLDILRQMVVAYGKATQENTLKYTKSVLDLYQNAYRAMAPPLNPFEFIQGPAAPHPAAPAVPWGSRTAQGSSPADTHQEKDETVGVDELKQRIEELESLVLELGARKTERKRKGKSRRTG
jgi:polyhydroxyalkanoate synthesis repressor PhaR